MSAFLVEDKTIGKILYQFIAKRRDGYQRKQDIELLSSALGFPNSNPYDALDIFALAMKELNEHGVNTRYEDKQTATATKVDIVRAEMIESYKALRCLIYQCSEGDIPETSELYKALDKLSDSWAHEIVQGTKGYEVAAWD